MKKSRNRIYYQSEGIYVSKDIMSKQKIDHYELIRLQESNYGFTMNKTDVNQYGKALRIDHINLDLPTVNFDMSYYLSDGYNERVLGFDISNTYQFAKTHIEETSGRNFYVVTSEEYKDAADLVYGDPYSLIGIGNAFITNYSASMSVGSLPLVNISCEASNINSMNGILSGEGPWEVSMTGDFAAMNMEEGCAYSGITHLSRPVNTGQNGPTALRPGDITLTFAGFDGNPSGAESIAKTSGAKSFHLQSANLDIPLSRSELKRLGSKGAYARVVNYPVKARLDVNAILTNIETLDLVSSVSGCSVPWLNNEIIISANTCDNTHAINWTLKQPTLLSERFSSNIGPSKSVDLSFEVEIGDVEDTSIGILCSGDAINRPLPKEDDSVEVPTRVYGYTLDPSFEGNAALASGVFVGDDDVFLDHAFVIPGSWKHNLASGNYGTRDNIRRVAVGGGTPYIPSQAFDRCLITGEVYIPPNIEYIGYRAFADTNITALIMGE